MISTIHLYNKLKKKMGGGGEKIKNFCENNIKKKKHDQYFPIS